MIDYIFGFFACMIYLKSFCTIILYFNLKFRWRGLFALTRLAVRLGLVRSGQVCGQRRSSASPRPPCDGTPSAFVWPSPRQTPSPSCLCPSDRTPPDATTKYAGGSHAWSIPPDPDKTHRFGGCIGADKKIM